MERAGVLELNKIDAVIITVLYLPEEEPLLSLLAIVLLDSRTGVSDSGVSVQELSAVNIAEKREVVRSEHVNRHLSLDGYSSIKERSTNGSMVERDVDQAGIVAWAALAPVLLIEAGEVGKVDSVKLVVARVLEKVDVVVVKCSNDR